MRPQLLFAILLGSIVTTIAAPSLAHCRKTTAGGDESYDATITGQCAGGAKALPLYWKESCVALRVVVDPELEAQGKMTMARASDIVQRATSEWAAVQCSGAGGATQPLAIRVVDAAREQCPAGSATIRNEVHFTAVPADGDGLLAVTAVDYDAVGGVMSRATMQLLDIYAGLGASPSSNRDEEVERVVRHEMGHFLGLAHSDNAGAVMYAGYDTRRTDGLTDDDVRGICDAYAADQPIGQGCSTAPSTGGPESAAWAVAAVIAWLALGRRRARQRRGGVLAATVVATIVLALTHASVASAQDPRPVPSPSTAARPGGSRGVAKKTAPKTKKPKPAPAVASRKSELSAQDAALLEHQDGLTRSGEAGPASYRVASLSAATLSVGRDGAAPSERNDPAASVAGAAGSPADAPAAVRDEPATAEPAAARTSDLYVGARYRAFVMPRFLVGLVGKSNEDLLFHSVSLEADFRKKSFSIVPALTFADLSTGDMLLGARSNDLASSFSYVRSDLKAIAASVGLVWSTPVSRTVELELGIELGLGATFGTLVDGWVHESANGPLAYGGRRFAQCQTVNDGFGCRPQDHGSPTPIRVGNYREKSFIDGGSAPTILPWVSLPLAGVRARVGNDLAVRAGIGASLTGIWAGVSLDYAVARADRR